MRTVRYVEPVDYVSTGREDWPLDEVYENYTFLDWMKESSVKLAARSVSKKWTVLVLTLFAVGYTAIFIDLASAWLHDFKKGLCFSKSDLWSLLSPYLTCPYSDWYDWLKVISGKDAAWSLVVLDFPIYLVLVCVCVLLAGYITFTRAPLVKQSGIPEIKLIIAGFNYHMDSYLGARMFLHNLLGLVLVVGSGFWLGKEGPLVHVACSLLTICFEKIYGGNKLEGLRRELLSAAVATGIAVAFNSPIGGVLFVVELLPSYFTPIKLMWNSFVSATIALVALYGFKVFTDGKNFIDEALFQVLFGNFSWLFLETIPFIFLGAVGALYGHIYTQMYMAFADKRRKHRVWRKLAVFFRVLETSAPYTELLLVAVATALCTFPLLLTKLPLGALLKLLFTDCPAEEISGGVSETNSSNFLCGLLPLSITLKLAYIFVQGFVLSAYSYGLSLPGGVLMPSFVLGGTIGRIVGILSQGIQNQIGASSISTCTAKLCIVSPSSYAVVGAAAFVTGITKLTLSVVVIIFELTGAVTYVLPIMVAVMTAKFLSDYLREDNIYDCWLSHEFNRDFSTADVLHTNSGKGDGLCDFGSISARFRARLPDVAIESVIVPLKKTRHLVLFPREPYSLTELHNFLADDNHEGYPLTASVQNPVNLGYVTKKNIYRLLLENVGNVQSGSVLLCFQAKVPQFLVPEEQAYEKQILENFESVRFVAVNLDHTTTIVKKTASLKQVIELFERLHLNTLVINDAWGHACGFIDRFKLSRLIHLGFLELHAQLPSEPSLDQEFDIENEDFSEDAERDTRPFMHRVYDWIEIRGRLDKRLSE